MNQVRHSTSSRVITSALPANVDLLYLRPGKRGTVEHREPLMQCWSMRFENSPPVRTFPSRLGRSSFPGKWWSATTGEHVAFESWSKRDQLMMLDFSSAVTGFSYQPFWLLWSTNGEVRRHAPDFFARRRDGTGVVIDTHLAEPTDLKDDETRLVTAAACASVGWSYRQLGALDPVLAANMRWIAGYRHPRYSNEIHRLRLQEAFADPTPLLHGADAAGDHIAVLPVLFHLIWTGVLITDLTLAPLSGRSLVHTRQDTP
ncbi:TnsA-like heteromeric transposase endonuclease subunit [Streptosporangium sp. NPDC000563]|uniref:TnsA-like heteromeric transposase endonuclease subunit n=1 Tax=Streptosporangium sp. NPDC000563 TaxID=3154366 RepID=UPI003320DD24